MRNTKSLIFLFILLLVIYSSTTATAQRIITTWAGNGTSGFSGDGHTARLAELNLPTKVCSDTAGNIYFTDTYNNVVRKINAGTHIITTVAGVGLDGYSGDIGLAVNAKMSLPMGVATDSAGNIYIADAGNHCIRKVNAVTGIITTIAGTGTSGFSGDGGMAVNAKLNSPDGVFVDRYGNVFIADYYNYEIRKINVATGKISTIAGTGTAGYSGDGGPAVSAQLNRPAAIFVDTSGNIFIADDMNNRIRKINGATGTISTITGNDTAGFSGDSALAINAKLNGPVGVCLGSEGNIFIADAGNERIRMIDGTTGIITTIAGDGMTGFLAEGDNALSAEMDQPYGICADKYDNVFFADKNNERIRKITAPLSVSNTAVQAFSIYPNPSQGIFTIQPKNNREKTIEVYNAVGTKVFTSQYLYHIDLATQPDGIYFIKLKQGGETTVQKLVIKH